MNIIESIDNKIHQKNIKNTLTNKKRNNCKMLNNGNKIIKKSFHNIKKNNIKKTKLKGQNIKINIMNKKG